MENNNDIEELNSTYSNTLDLSENATILEEGLRLCPLCQSEIKMFFINFNVKMLMCENAECEYPFGHDELQFFQVNEMQSEEELFSMRSKLTMDTMSATCSVETAAAWSEIDRINKVCDSEDSQFDVRSNKSIRMRTIDKHTRLKQEQILKNVEDIKGLSSELMEINRAQSRRHILNQKWIKNLLNIQSKSGVLLVKPQEENLLKKKETKLGLGELTIDIDTGGENKISSIKIELTNNKDTSEKTNDEANN